LWFYTHQRKILGNTVHDLEGTMYLLIDCNEASHDI
jgi:hypothetical protein